MQRAGRPLVPPFGSTPGHVAFESRSGLRLQRLLPGAAGLRGVDPEEVVGEGTSELAKEIVKRIKQALPSAKRLVAEFEKKNISLATLTDVMAFNLPLTSERKLDLLAESDVLKRAKSLLKMLAPKTPGLQSPRREPPGFSNN